MKKFFTSKLIDQIIFSLSISCISYFFYIIYHLKINLYIKRLTHGFIKNMSLPIYHHEFTLPYTILFLGIIGLLYFWGKYFLKRVIHVFFSICSIGILFILPFVSCRYWFAFLYVCSITWIIYTIINLIKSTINWVIEDKKTQLPKLTFIWGILVAILGYILKGSLK